jgi:hypothetical protein
MDYLIKRLKGKKPIKKRHPTFDIMEIIPKITPGTSSDEYKRIDKIKNYCINADYYTD